MKRSELYAKLRDVAKEGMPYLQYVDIQKQQFRKAKDEYPIPLPALLIEFKQTQFSDVLKNNQIGTMTVSIYLYLDLVTDSFDGAVMETETIQLLDKLDDVFQTLEGINCDLFSQLIRTDEQIFEYGTRYICLRTDFTAGIKDIKNSTIQQTITTRPKIVISTDN